MVMQNKKSASWRVAVSKYRNPSRRNHQAGIWAADEALQRVRLTGSVGLLDGRAAGAQLVRTKIE